MRVYGVDFTCAPRRAKPITVACGRLRRNLLEINEIQALEGFAAFEAFLATPGPWIGGFDFPFSLPRELVRDLSWPADWPALVTHCAAMTRLELRAALDAYRQKRPMGRKYAHRATDVPAGSSSPMKLVNPPVALMYQEGAPRLLKSGVHVPALREGDTTRVALEAYPGLFVRKHAGVRESYKSDARSEHTPARRAARRRILQALRAWGVALEPRLERRVLADGSGDLLDAAICAAQAAWGWKKRDANYGLPRDAPAGEGWIVTA